MTLWIDSNGVNECVPRIIVMQGPVALEGGGR